MVNVKAYGKVHVHKMNLNQIKSLDKKELLQSLKQNGFHDVVTILEDKDIDGEKLIELKEYETFRWRLTLSQKKCLWNCIREIKSKPASFTAKPKPAGRIQATSTTSARKSLEGYLGTNAANSSSSPNSAPTNKPPKSPIAIPSRQHANDRLSPNLRRVPAPPPVAKIASKLPPIAFTTPTTITTIKKSPLPLPPKDEIRSNDETLAGYLTMTAPDQQIDDYLTPIELENVYEPAPDIRNRNRKPGYVNGVPLNIRQPIRKPFPEALDASNSRTNNVLPLPKRSTSPSPNTQPKVTATHFQQNEEFNKKPVITPEDDDDADDVNIYEPPPLPLKSKAIPTDSVPTETSNDKIISNENNTSTVTKQYPFKNLGGVLITDGTESNQSPVRNIVTNTLLGRFFGKNSSRKNTSRNCYENCTIAKENAKETVTNKIIDRALPSVPVTSEQTDSLFDRPFPVPRKIQKPLRVHSYIQVISVKGEQTINEQEYEYNNVIQPIQENEYGNADRKESINTAANANHQKLYPILPKTSNLAGIENERKLLGIKFKKSQLFNKSNALEDEQETYANTSNVSSGERENDEDETYQNVSSRDRITGVRLSPQPDQNYVTLVKATDGGKKHAEEHQLHKATATVSEKGNINNNINSARNNSHMWGRPNASDSKQNLHSTATNQPHLDLATILARKLKERETRLQNKDTTVSKESHAVLEAREISPTSTRSHSNPDSDADTFSDTDHEDDGNKQAIIQKRVSKALNEILLKPLPNTAKANFYRSVSAQDDDSADDPVYGNTEQRDVIKNIKFTNLSDKINKSHDNLEGAVKSNYPKLLAKRQNYERHYIKSEGEAAAEPADTSGKDADGDESSNRNILDAITEDPFYRNTNRRGANALLRGLRDGSFLFRPSKSYFLCLSVRYRSKCHHLGIDRNGNKIRLNAEGDSMSPEFSSLEEFVEHFTRERVSFRLNKNDFVEILLDPVFPPAVNLQ